MILPDAVRDHAHTWLRVHADETHAQYAQYAGYFDTWVLGRVIAPVKFKGGSTLQAGALTLMSPHVTESAPELGATRSTYDWQTGHVVAMPANTIVDVV